MPKINRETFDNTQASGNGGGHNLDPGAYVCAIQSIKIADDDWLKAPSIDLIFDVVEGEKAGTFSDEWSAEHDFAHRITINYEIDPSYEYSSLRNLKSLATAIDESNPGTDFLAAFEADNFTLLVGKKFGLVINGEERTNNGYTNINIARFNYTIFPADKVRNDEIKIEPKVKLENGNWKDAPTWDEYCSVHRDSIHSNASRQSAASSAYDDSDVPF